MLSDFNSHLLALVHMSETEIGLNSLNLPLRMP